MTAGKYGNSKKGAFGPGRCEIQTGSKGNKGMVNTGTGFFTMDKALAIQADNLIRWSSVLNRETLEALSAEVTRRNSIGYDSPYNVWRGNDLIEFVLNAQTSEAK